MTEALGASHAGLDFWGPVKKPVKGLCYQILCIGSLKGIWTDRTDQIPKPSHVGPPWSNQNHSCDSLDPSPWRSCGRAGRLEGRCKHPDSPKADSGRLLPRLLDPVPVKQTWGVWGWTGLQKAPHVAWPILSTRCWKPEIGTTLSGHLAASGSLSAITFKRPGMCRDLRTISLGWHQDRSLKGTKGVWIIPPSLLM